MYELITIKDTIKIPPKLFSESLEKSAVKALRERYEGKIKQDFGVIITAINPREITDGKIIPGEGGTYHKITFDLLTFKPKPHEIIKGKVSELTEFGAFIRFGPIDGLVHVSQITDDYMSLNSKTQALTGKESKKIIKKDDEVTARIIAISLKNNITESKINLTMRQEGLGKEEWIKLKNKKKRTKAKKTSNKKKK